MQIWPNVGIKDEDSLETKWSNASTMANVMPCVFVEYMVRRWR